MNLSNWQDAFELLTVISILLWPFTGCNEITYLQLYDSILLWILIFLWNMNTSALQLRDSKNDFIFNFNFDDKI